MADSRDTYLLEPHWLDQSGLCRLMSLTPEAFAQLIDAGYLPYPIRGPGDFERWSLDEVMRYAKFCEDMQCLITTSEWVHDPPPREPGKVDRRADGARLQIEPVWLELEGAAALAAMDILQFGALCRDGYFPAPIRGPNDLERWSLVEMRDYLRSCEVTRWLITREHWYRDGSL